MPDDIIARLKSHDADALASFHQSHRPQLMAFIERQLGTALRRKVEPDDIYQETCAEAVRALPTTELGDRDPFSWLCQIAERRIIDLHRRFFDAKKRDAGREVPLGSGGGTDSQPAGLINMLVASMTRPCSTRPCSSCPTSSARPCGCATSRTCRASKSPTSWARATRRCG
jgi:RNA polymerase sigma-70 factor (ECF subfamily)